MMTTKNKQNYRAAWRAQVNSLMPLALASNCDPDRWNHLKSELYLLIEDAAERDFPSDLERPFDSDMFLKACQEENKDDL